MAQWTQQHYYHTSTSTGSSPKQQAFAFHSTSDNRSHTVPRSMYQQSGNANAHLNGQGACHRKVDGYHPGYASEYPNMQMETLRSNNASSAVYPVFPYNMGSSGASPGHHHQGTHSSRNTTPTISPEGLYYMSDFMFEEGDSMSQGVYPPPAFHFDSTATTAMSQEELTSQGPPILICRFGPCGAKVRVDIDSLTRHLLEVHGVIKADKKKAQVCQWTGCRCSGRAFRVGRCPPGEGPHAAHVENIPEHIWERHLHFRYVCRQCDRAEWSDRSSLDRHSKKCTGRVSVRCARCFRPFATELDLVLHASTCEAL